MERCRKWSVVAVAAVLGVFGALAGANPAGAVPPDQAQNEHARIVAYWTPERIAQAIPRDYVLDPTTRKFQPTAKPGSGGSSSTVLGASWNGGGTVLMATGKVFFTMGSTAYVCSGSAVRDAATERSLVLTAGHCVYDETNQQFATNWMFIPDYDSKPAALTTSGSFCSATALGCWTANSLAVDSGFATAGSFNTQATLHDFGIAEVRGGGLDGQTQLDSAVTDPPVMQFSSARLGGDTYLFGYPAAQKYKGNDLVYCRGPLGTDPYNANLTYKVGCDMTGGASGGPWYQPFDAATGTGTVMSVNSYVYKGITALHGPFFNANTQAVYNAAETANGDNTIVPVTP